MMDSAYAWKRYYRDERSRLGRALLLDLLDAAEPLPMRPGGAIVVPHTRLEVTGEQIARAVATVLASGADRVLALGVLHGGRRADADLVAAARTGDEAARGRLRGVHTADGLAAEEFSLDAFEELLQIAAAEQGRTIDVIARYPFLVGAEPDTLPGVDELAGILADGALLVATTDPIHHGHAYGTPPADCLDRQEPATMRVARAAIGAQLDALAGHRYDEFAVLCEQHRSDFRDVGPVLAHLLGDGIDPVVHDLDLVDYSGALAAPEPTWVAAGLVTV